MRPCIFTASCIHTCSVRCTAPLQQHLALMDEIGRDSLARTLADRETRAREVRADVASSRPLHASDPWSERESMLRQTSAGLLSMQDTMSITAAETGPAALDWLAAGMVGLASDAAKPTLER
eukprot:6808701-Prymnesium_polylepis.1